MLSIVIPVFNEADSLETLHRQLREVVAAGVRGRDPFRRRRLPRRFLECHQPPGGRGSAGPGIRFRRNFGKAAALRAGFAQRRGELDDLGRRPPG